MDLHVLNGDALATSFSLEGERLSMREALIDGPLAAETDEAFEALRAGFVSEAYEAFPDQADPVTAYLAHVASAWHRARQAGPQDRLLLWFDADAFCQINTLFWLQWIGRPGMQAKAFYIYPQAEDFGQMSPSDLEACLNEAIPIGPSLTVPATAAWQALARQDFDALEQATAKIPPTHAALRRALAWYAHHYRPEGAAGHPHIQRLIDNQRRLFPNEGRASAFARFSRAFPQAGLGDTQFFRLAGMQE
jgi:hypothetical protein